ncbi:MAG: Ig-like domain-containing protein [Lentimicrobiaceae bacterium]|nr:Ig-like domain-containing protein [Lentimicrobiaceae bacterium]
MNSRLLFIAAVAVALLTAACTEDPHELVIPVTGITLNSPPTTLLVGETLSLEAAVEPAEATNKSVTWNSDDDQVATVNTEGVLTAVAPGVATITATSHDGKFTANCTVTVEVEVIPVTGITLNSPPTSLTVGATLTLDAAIAPADATNKTVVWSSDDEHVATVNSEGVLTAVAPGVATITATTDDGGFAASFSVTVSEPGIITMITQATGVGIAVWIKLSEAIVNFTIDWGDGKKSIIEESSYMPPWPDVAVDFRFEHNYSGASEHLITITGSNIELLSCGGNKLTTLDVSRCPELKTLYCWNNQLTNVNVSGNTELISLECMSNQLTALDVSNCIALESLGLSGNLLTVLDVSNCTALKSLSVSYCQLAALDVSKCTELEQLWCPGNQLKSLDVSHNTELRLLPCDVNLFTAEALNDLFRSLPYISERNPYWDWDCPMAISIYGNPGTDDCDFSIAEKKGWCQRGIMPASLEVSVEPDLNFIKTQNSLQYMQPVSKNR